MKYYLAYGSNLNKGQMAHRCPDAEPIGTAILEDHKLVFRRGFLTVEPEKGSQVPLGVWLISKADEKALDRYEGYPTFYRKQTSRVMMSTGEEVEALIYIMQDGHPLQVPSDYYFYTVYHGYTEFGMDKAPLVRAYEAVKWPEAE